MEGQIKIPAAGVRSLVWSGDSLIDWAAGGKRFELDGTTVRSGVFFAFPFNAAVATADGEWVFVYQRLGTKGLLLRNGEHVREINRSYYHAHVYEYPVCLWRDSSGRALLAHCPEGYNRIEIEDAETGERLTSSSARSPNDFFHSRLTVSPDGTRLLSAGWIWHPFDLIAVFDIASALSDPQHLDQSQSFPSFPEDAEIGEISSACWQSNARLILSGGDEAFGESLPSSLVVLDMEDQDFVSSTQLDGPAGAMMAVGAAHIVTFFEFPRLVEISSGRSVNEWPQLPTGKQTGSIIHHLLPLPTLALNPTNRRFAVASDDEISVVTIPDL